MSLNLGLHFGKTSTQKNHWNRLVMRTRESGRLGCLIKQRDKLTEESLHVSEESLLLHLKHCSSMVKEAQKQK